MKTSHLTFTLAAALGILLGGCGQSEKPAGSESATAPAASGKQPAGAPAAASARLIEITGNDAMKFSVTEIRAKPGESLTVKLSNIGTMPKMSMGHNWILLQRTANVEKFVTDAAQAPTTDYVPAAHRDQIIAHTKLLGPKESDSVTFQAPKEPGRNEFLCSFPGHYQIGMKGTLIVE